MQIYLIEMSSAAGCAIDNSRRSHCSTGLRTINAEYILREKS